MKEWGGAGLAILLFTYMPTIIMALAVSYDIDPAGTNGSFIYPVYVWGAYVAISLIGYAVYHLLPDAKVVHITRITQNDKTEIELLKEISVKLDRIASLSDKESRSK
jgi:hypothetical protein